MQEIVIISLIISNIVNWYWTWQGRKIQNDKEIIKSLQIQLGLKESAVQTMRDKKNVIKSQLEHQLSINRKLEGELDAYRRKNF